MKCTAYHMFLPSLLVQRSQWLVNSSRFNKDSGDIHQYLSETLNRAAIDNGCTLHCNGLLYKLLLHNIGGPYSLVFKQVSLMLYNCYFDLVLLQVPF